MNALNNTMQGAFPKNLYRAVITKGVFPSGNFPTVHFSKRQVTKSVLVTALSPQSNLTFGKLSLKKSPLEKPLGNYLTPFEPGPDLH